MEALSKALARFMRHGSTSLDVSIGLRETSVDPEGAEFLTPVACKSSQATQLEQVIIEEPLSCSRFITASTSACDDGISSATLSSSSSSFGRCHSTCTPAVANVVTASGPSTTDLNHFHAEVHLDNFGCMGKTYKARKISHCCMGRGEVELHDWREVSGQECESMVVKRVPLACLWENKDRERDECAVYRLGCNRQMEDTLTEIGIYSYFRRKQTSSPYILKMHATLQSDTEAWLILQYADGGDLFDVVKGSKEPMSQQQALGWTEQLLKAVDFLHSHCIGHRDISIENILLHGGDVQLMDFGQAVQTHSDSGCALRYFCALGKPYYRAPERNVPVASEVEVVVPAGSRPGDSAFVHLCTSGDEYLCEVLLPGAAVVGQSCIAEPLGYTVPPVDVFSCGVCFFIMVAGIPPWQKATPRDPHFAFVQKSGIGALLGAHGKKLQPPMQTFLAAMLEANPTQRATVEDCLTHLAVTAPSR